MTEWFENWFNSKYYHLLYNQRNKKEAKLFLDNILNYLKPKKKSLFLDLGCGTGRHSIYLNKKGFLVDGVDLSEKSLEIAKIHENEKLHFFLEDMRRLNTKNKYNYVFNLFTSFGYFENKKDNKLVVQGISKALKKNGIFMIDFLNMENCLKNIIKTEQKIIKDTKFKIRKWHDNKFLYKEIKFKHNNKEETHIERVQILKKKHIINLCKQENLKLMNEFGDYLLNKFDEKSERLILLFKKVIN